MSDELDLVNAEVVLGVDMEKFLETEVGRYFMGCSDQDEKDAIETMMNFDPYAFPTLGELQSSLANLQQNVHIARKVKGYISDAIITARQAEEILQNQEE